MLNINKYGILVHGIRQLPAKDGRNAALYPTVSVRNVRQTTGSSRPADRLDVHITDCFTARWGACGQKKCSPNRICDMKLIYIPLVHDEHLKNQCKIWHQISSSLTWINMFRWIYTLSIITRTQIPRSSVWQGTQQMDSNISSRPSDFSVSIHNEILWIWLKLPGRRARVDR